MRAKTSRLLAACFIAGCTVPAVLPQGQATTSGASPAALLKLYFLPQKAGEQFTYQSSESVEFQGFPFFGLVSAFASAFASGSASGFASDSSSSSAVAMPPIVLPSTTSTEVTKVLSIAGNTAMLETVSGTDDATYSIGVNPDGSMTYETPLATIATDSSQESRIDPSLMSTGAPFPPFAGTFKPAGKGQLTVGGTTLDTFEIAGQGTQASSSCDPTGSCMASTMSDDLQFWLAPGIGMVEVSGTFLVSYAASPSNPLLPPFSVAATLDDVLTGISP